MYLLPPPIYTVKKKKNPNKQGGICLRNVIQTSMRFMVGCGPQTVVVAVYYINTKKVTVTK